jgi:hypothetical protein
MIRTKNPAEFIVVFTATLAISGCCSLPPYEPASIPKGMGVVYIYQISGPMLGGTCPIVVNSKPVIVMENGAYYPHFAHPGENEITASKGTPSTVAIDVEEGQSYYVKCSYSMRLGPPSIHLTVVSKEVGEREIVECGRLGTEE